MNLAKRQLAQTRRENEATLRKRARETLRNLRSEIKAARAARKQKLRAVGTRLRAWTRKDSSSSSSSSSSKAREKRAESDDEVLANIDDPGLRIVFLKIAKKIKAGKHRSRTEAFAEWAAEHVADVYAIQEADAERHLLELEKKERKLARALERPGRYREPAGLEVVPF